MSGQGGYPPQGGYPQQGQQGGYQQGGYPQQGQQGGYQQGGYPQQGQQGGYQQGGYQAQGQWTARSGPGGPSGQGGGQPGRGGGPAPRPAKSPLLIIGIVVAAVVLLVALGGIFIALGSGGGGSSPAAPITPDASQAPTPTSKSSTGSSGRSPSAPSSSGTGGTSSEAVDLGHSISLTPASGYTVESQKTSLVVVSNGTEVFVGQVAEQETDADPKQIVDSYHRQLAEDYTNVSYTDAKTVNLKNSELEGALGGMTGTSSGGSGSQEVGLQSLASVRTSDGVTVVGTILYTPASDTTQVGQDFSAMVNSMLKTQAG